MVKVKEYLKKSKTVVKCYRELRYRYRVLKNLFKDNISEKRKNISIYNIMELSADINELRTFERYICNDFYGNISSIKEYIGMKQIRSSNIAVEHGIYYADHFWGNDVESGMAILFTPSRRRVGVLSKVTNQKIYPIGPLIHYAKEILSDDFIEAEKIKNGKTLLVFPVHSTHHNEVKYDDKDFCKEIEKIKKREQFATVLICLYWKDILRGYAKNYLDFGFKCVTAGHIYDMNFLPRLKSIIKIADMTMSNSVGTHIGYCVYLNKSHYIVDTEYEYDIKNYKNEAREFMEKYKRDEGIERIKKVFSEYNEEITEEQKRIVEEFWGTNCIRTVDEMRELFNKAKKYQD